jgi:hypothetical protein
VVSRGEGEDDGVPRDKRNLMVTTVALILSRGRSRGRLELGDGTVTFG